MFKYIYQSDLEKYGTSLDIWEVINPDADGVYRGDCESYCRTLKKLDSTFKDWGYYYCKLDGVGHCILIKGNEVIDCNTQQIVTLEQYYKMFKIMELKPYNKFQVISKIVFAKGYLIWRKLRGL